MKFEYLFLSGMQLEQLEQLELCFKNTIKRHAKME